MIKKKILVVALGYPTKNNPIEGSFFKEQIDFISKEYECSVLVYKEYCKKILFAPKIMYNTLEYTKGIIQYYPIVYISYFRRLIEIIGSIIRKKMHNEPAVGIYKSTSYRKYRRKVIKKIIDDLQLDYNLVYCITAQGIAYQALQFAELSNKPLVVSEHRPFPHPGWSTIDVEKEAFEKANCFFAIGKDKIRQILLQNIKLKRIAYIGNLIDETQFAYNPISHRYPTLIIIAAYSYFKNYDMFFETISKLDSKTKTDYRVIVAGYGANKDYIGDIEQFEKEIKQLSFSNKIELIREVPRSDVSPLLNRSDAFVMTSIQEGQPMVALEAACCGLPIFSTRCGGVEDYVDDEIGRLVDITDSDALSDYLKNFIENKLTFDSNIIRNKVIQKYGRDAFMKNIKFEFDRLL